MQWYFRPDQNGSRFFSYIICYVDFKQQGWYIAMGGV